MSVNTTSYVSLRYFFEKDPFADFVVHEVAHLFHNTKRRTIGLHHTRRRQWLLPIDYNMRETFAYACEAYRKILEHSTRPSDRAAHLEQLKKQPPPADERVVADDYFGILDDAVRRRNGWKAILERCAT
jgi:hypothetical protein